MRSLEKRLDTDQNLREEYQKIIHNHENKGYVRKLNDDEIKSGLVVASLPCRASR